MIFDWEGSTVVLPAVADWDTDVWYYQIPTFDIAYLHAGITTMLYHAEGTTGESTPVIVFHNLVDHAGNRLTDGEGNYIIVADTENAILLHAKATDTLYHAER